MEIRPLSEALQKKAAEELNETLESVKTNVQLLREWLAQQPHLQSVNPSDQWLVAFLRGCKHDIEKAQRKIDMYYTLRATIPEFYANRDPQDPGIQEILKLGVLLPLKAYISDDSPKMMLTRAGMSSLTRQPLSNVIKVALMIVEVLLLEDDNFTVAGEDVIVDCQGISLSVLWHWTPSLVKKMTSCSEKSLSVRVKSLHFLNAPFFFGPALALFKMFLGAKIKDRIHLHTKNCDTLFEHIDKSVLPKEYGGTDGTVLELTEYWKAKMESHREWFLDESCSDESKRLKKTN